MAKKKSKNVNSAGQVGQNQAERIRLANQPDPEPDSPWSKMVEAHPGHPTLQSDTIYALPTDMIGAIRSWMPGFFSDEELQFELDLALLAGGGFFYKRPFSQYDPIAPANAESDLNSKDQEKRLANVEAKIGKMLTDEFRKDGRDKTEIVGHFDDEQEFNAHFDSRRWGFAGWLATHGPFRAGCQELKSRWSSRVRERGFPRIPLSFFGEKPEPVPRHDQECYSDFLMFFKRWGVETLITWELPLPMSAALATPNMYHLPILDDAGLLVFAPWYLLRDRDVKLKELLWHRQFLHAPMHLSEWFDRDPKKLGHKRFQTMLIVLVTLELVIRQRYKTNINRRIGEFDRVLAAFVCELTGELGVEQMVDTIKKVRQAMDDRLKGA